MSRYCITFSDAEIASLDRLADYLALPRSSVLGVLVHRAAAEVFEPPAISRPEWQHAPQGVGLRRQLDDVSALLERGGPAQPRLATVRAILSRLWLAGSVGLPLTPQQQADLSWFDRRRAALVDHDLGAVRKALVAHRAELVTP